jgi:hypothetical protein
MLSPRETKILTQFDVKEEQEEEEATAVIHFFRGMSCEQERNVFSSDLTMSECE